ncbi:MAG: translocation/assembly module TamB domain-containing protein, partial [Bacteroidetes bacterium]|nr:translocation/assembly module TamB domain-containing protein [Bacteroidota bacterium]
EIRTKLNYDLKKGTLVANGTTLNETERLTFDVLLYTSDSLASQNKISLNTQRYPITLLERFLGDLFSDITGYLTGDITIGGDLNRPAVTGKGLLSNAGLRVNYTQCYYRIEDKEIELTPSRIELNGLVLRDTITNNPIYVTGGIDHESFYNLFYDLDVSTRKPGTRGEQENRPVQLLRTNRADNELFFGDVKGTALLQLRGPQSDMVMTLNATASDKDSSYVTLPPGSGRESGNADFLVERKFGKEIEAEDYGRNGDNILFDLELTANPLVQVKVVLDELTGDEIKGKGSGTLKIRSGTTEPLTLRGRLGIEEGSYLFTFQSFFKKPFEIRKGSTNYIEWNGDPYDADIKFEAVYKSERVSFAPLASTLNLTADVSNARSDVFVVAKLTDKLFKPNIAFSLDFPPNSIANVNPELTLLLRQLQNNINELNRQVTYLIVFNSFAPNELGGSLSGAGVNVSTISGILLSVLSDQINKLFSNLLRSDKYRINLNTSLYNRNLLASNSTALNLGSNVNFSIGRSFFDNRFIISTGLGMDAPLGQGAQSSVQQSILLLPDVTMEWLINPSGTIRASFFYRTNADFLTASTSASVVRSRRAGASLSYKREYDKLSDIFGGAKRKKKSN